MQNPLRGKYPLTQSWEEHLRNAGPTLGGEDYAMPIGTRLPALEGTVEYIAQGSSRDKASWYNTGLGNAVCFRRPDGSGTVMGHLSGMDGRVPLSGNSGKSSGPHVHVHDIATDGRTRLRPFTTATAPASGGGAGAIGEPITPAYPEDDTMRIYSNTDEDGRCYFFTDTSWEVVADANEAKHLALMLHGSESAPRVNGYQINWLKKRVDAARAKLTFSPPVSGVTNYTITMSGEAKPA